MEQAEVKYAPGMRIIVRGEEWMVKKVETNSLGNQTLYVIGLSQLVKDYESMFLVDVENDIEIVDPAKVTLVPDDSAFFRKSKVYIESQWRSKIPTDNKIHIGNKAAMDLMSYQLEPAQMALNKTKLFDIGNTRKYSLNVYADNNGCVSFDSISNLFETFTIDESYQGDDLEEVEGIKNKLNEWNTKGHSQRIIHICEDDLSLFNSVFGDGTGNPNGAKLPAIHTQGLLDILRKFASQERKMSEIGETITLSEMWHETNDTKAKIIKRVEHFPNDPMREMSP